MFRRPQGLNTREITGVCVLAALWTCTRNPYTYTSQGDTRGGVPGPKAEGTLAGAKKAKDRSSVRGFDNKWERHAKSDAMHICSQTPTNTQTSESMIFRWSSGPKPLELTGVCVLQVPWSMIFRKP